VNTVCLVGRLARSPVVRFAGEHQTTTEAAGVLEGDDMISLSGKLCWRKHTDKHGQEKSMLAVDVREVSVLQPAALPA
jgi:single-stranded DNA-binding protein